MKTARSYSALILIFLIELSGVSCRLASLPNFGAPANLSRVTVVPSTPIVDATATFAAQIIESALSTTYTPAFTPTPSETPMAPLPPTPNQAATQTREAEIMATAVAATLTAAAGTLAFTPTEPPLPTDTPTLPPPPPPTFTSAPLTVVLEMINIPAGEFVMGSSAPDIELTLQECNQTEGNCQFTWFDGETPVRSPFLPEFWISKYEVTNSQYKICVANGVCPPIGRIPVETDIPYDATFFADPLPAVAVSWDNANTFCRWVGARLPIEEEWEKAARGVDGSRRYPWGYTFEPGRANLASGAPTAVGSYPSGASPYGVMDMAGNVFEWTATGTGDGRYLLRGGGWSKFYFRGRATDRGTKLVPNFVNYDIGFRCAR